MNNYDFSKFQNLSFSSLVDHILSLSGEEFAIFACILGYAIASSTDINEQDSLGNFFELLGQFLLTVSAQNYKIATNKKN
jgi:hypothetical protein